MILDDFVAHVGHLARASRIEELRAAISERDAETRQLAFREGEARGRVAGIKEAAKAAHDAVDSWRWRGEGDNDLRTVRSVARDGVLALLEECASCAANHPNKPHRCGPCQDGESNHCPVESAPPAKEAPKP